jgi:glucose 1-dehydrogenase
MPGRLAGKYALITGSSRGIGRAVAECFSAEGAVVALNHINDADAAAQALAAVRAASPGSAAHRIEEADIGSPAQCSALVERVITAFGRLDILVNNAGIQSETPGDAFDDAALERILSVNLIGAATCSRDAIRHFLSRPGGGTVINTSSVHQIIPKPNYLAYSLSKGGIGNLTRTLALEFADRDIRVNAVAPGAVVTDLNRSWADDPAKRSAVEAHIPMGRAGEPAEIAPVYAFLASEDARYITGQTIYVCGGLTLYNEFRQTWSS